MKAPITSNSITDRVMYTGMYVPEPAEEGEREQDARSHEAQSVSEKSSLQS